MLLSGQAVARNGSKVVARVGSAAAKSSRPSSHPRVRTKAAASKDLFCVGQESLGDGSTLFRFSEEKPPEPVAAVEEPAPAAVEETPPAPAPAAVKEAPPAPKKEEEKPAPKKMAPPPAKGFGSKAPEQTAIQPAVIIGAGRVGEALASMGGGKDVVLRRGDPFPADAPAGPIIVCTRNDVLEQVVHGIPPGRWGDLVFLQNGVLQPWLEKKGLQKCTQMLAYFAVAKLGDPVTDGKTELNPEGLTSITGKWGEAVAQRLHAQNLSCHVLSKEDYAVRMFEKLIWICSFMVVGASHGGCTVGEVCQEHRSQLSEVISELAGVCSATQGVTFGPHLTERLCSYGMSVAHFPTAVKEFEWRNGFFYNISENAIASGKDDPAPLHSELLKAMNVLA